MTLVNLDGFLKKLGEITFDFMASGKLLLFNKNSLISRVHGSSVFVSLGFKPVLLGSKLSRFH